MDATDSYGSPVSPRLSPRAAAAVLAVVVTACGVTEVVAANAGAPTPQGTRPARISLAASTRHVHARPEVTRRTTTPPATVWVGADVATVWIKPKFARRVDAPALRAHPSITEWLNRQTLRQREDLDTRVMTQALHGDELVQIKQRDRWSKVRLPDQFGSGFPDGIVGWIPTRQLTTTQPSHSVLHANVRRHGSGLVALRIARSYLGARYLWGGMTGLGIDCSGLTYRVFRQLGVVLPRDAADQSRIGTHVDRDALRPGDLVFFGSRDWRAVHHVGIYAGHGRILHAPHTGTVVQITPLRMFHDYWGARRVV